jgi:hypothetical protein
MDVKMSVSDPPPNLPSLESLHSELEQYRKTGRALHLADAARALGVLRLELQTMQAAGGKQRALATDNWEIAA